MKLADVMLHLAAELSKVEVPPGAALMCIWTDGARVQAAWENLASPQEAARLLASVQQNLPPPTDPGVPPPSTGQGGSAKSN